MDLKYGQIAHQRALIPERPVYLLYGREQVLLEEVLEKLLSGVRQAHGASPEVQGLYGSAATCEQIALELANLSLMGMGKVVVVREAQGMRSAEQTRLATLVPRLKKGALLVLMAGEPTYDSRTKKRRVLNERLETAVREAGVAIEVPAFRKEDAVAWLREEAKSAGVLLEPQAAWRMVNLAGTDLLRLRNELAKVAAYVGPSAVATVETVEQVVSHSPEATVFRVVDAIGERRPDQALAALKTLLDRGEAEQHILALIARQIRLIWQAKWLAEQGYLKGKGDQVPPEVHQLLPREGSTNVLRELSGKEDYLREKWLRQAAAFSWKALRQGLERILAADLAIKGIDGEVDNPRLILEMLVLELASSDRLPHRAARGGI